ncbi:Mediator of RNA polymerase II transcription subunit 31 [Cryoendolithus antarcticus]|uniref:Mediator of RNA polymerase II transcription subunit 31 n=1 Tax=Cryoendolithus antarcticus TaxID=1507870 RepID=A0A1V8SP78_9PEZI|nr:Mediator of RNA polymerase II transcription subunit 31 [Cryoendolithus antarcticus]
MAAPRTNGVAAVQEAETFNSATRFEIELEFVQSLSSPLYLHHLATQQYFASPEFIAYLKYLLYFTQPEYLVYLTYPGPTLKNLELLQTEEFRRDLLNPGLIERMVNEGIAAAYEGGQAAAEGASAT